MTIEVEPAVALVEVSTGQEAGRPQDVTVLARRSRFAVKRIAIGGTVLYTLSCTVSLR